jgi:hypothetical protein
VELVEPDLGPLAHVVGGVAVLANDLLLADGSAASFQDWRVTYMIP